MKRIREFLRKKIRGDSSYLAALISICILLILFMGLFYSYGRVISENEVHRVHRKYLLAMEREGYLSAANVTNLQNDLAANNCSNIVITGSLSPVGYGNEVTLKIECDFKYQKISLSGDSASAGEGVAHIVIEKSGTALY